MFSEKDIVQIKSKGLTEEKVVSQIENFKSGFPFINLYAPAILDNGLLQLSQDEVNSLVNYFDNHVKDYEVIKFVPASGAASRMFKHLFEFMQAYSGSQEDIDNYLSDKGFNSVYSFISSLKKFAFYSKLEKVLQENGHSIDELINKNDFKPILKYFITDSGMDYASLPKGLLLFHNYPEEPRTSVEEHLVEGAIYSTDVNGNSRVHLTVSKDHQEKFQSKIEEKKSKYEDLFKVKYDISFSQQKSYTDIIAVTPDNEPFRNEDGSLLFRPGGHGALIENLNDLSGEIIFIKNIDNIVPDRLRDTTYQYKKAIGGLLIDLQEKTFDYLEILDSGNVTDEELGEIAKFATDKLFISIPDAFLGYESMEKVDYLFNKLNRPIRICGMVKNEGEPGGGPFWTINESDEKSLQIVESSQIDFNNPHQKEIVSQSTHFNPVDLVCGVRDFKGNNFDLMDFIDHGTGFISEKSQSGSTLKAQELPGLWNGAMADWITIFVETPIITFNPVKTVNDLLRPQHQPE